MKLFSGFFGIAALTLAGCKPDLRPNAAEDSTFKTFEVQGMLREVSPDHRTATIQPQKIPGYN